MEIDLQTDEREWNNLLKRSFLEEGLAVDVLHSRVAELLQLPAETEISLLFQLGQINTTAAFLFWNQLSQRDLEAWAKAKTWGPKATDCVLALTSVWPRGANRKTIFLENGRALLGEVSWARPAAFRELSWSWRAAAAEIGEYSSHEMELLIEQQWIRLAALVAGIKSYLLTLATQYSRERVQGGRLIRDWSEVQGVLAELQIEAARDRVFASTLKDQIGIKQVLGVIGKSDEFASQALQIFGGAGYVEDFQAERHFREIVFLKNWLCPFAEMRMKTSDK